MSLERFKIQVDPLLLEEIEARVANMIAEQDMFADREPDELEDMGFSEYDVPLTPSGEPWDSTLECVVREVIVMTLVLAARGVRDGRIQHLDEPNLRLAARARHPAAGGQPRLRLVRDPDDAG